MRECRTTKSRNPIEIMQKIMADPYIYMHGPEHHVMAGAALLAAYHNCGGEVACGNERTGRTGAGRRVRVLGMLRSRCQHWHLYEYHNKSHAFKREILGAFQPYDIQSFKRHR